MSRTGFSSQPLYILSTKAKMGLTMAKAYPPDGNIFISYRRQDTSANAGRIYDSLAGWMGKRRLFLDVDSLELATDFSKVIETQLQRCSALVVIIGRDWLVAPNTGGRARLFDDKDFVRLEMETALRAGVKIVPVLVNQAAMPTVNELPESLADFAHLNALIVRDGRDYGRDLEDLKSTLSKAAPATHRSRLLRPLILLGRFARRRWILSPLLAYTVVAFCYYPFGQMKEGVVVTAAALSPDGKMVASIVSHYLYLTDGTGTEGMKELKLDMRQHHVQSLRFLEKLGAIAAVSYTTVNVYDLASGARILRIPLPVSHIEDPPVFARQGSLMAVPGQQNVEVWNLENNRIERRLVLPSVVQPVSSVRTDYRCLATCPGTDLLLSISDRGICIWNMVTGENLTPVPDGKRMIAADSAHFDGNGRRIVVTRNREASVWDIVQGTLVQRTDTDEPLLDAVYVGDAEGTVLLTTLGGAAYAWKPNASLVRMQREDGNIGKALPNGASNRVVIATYDGRLDVHDLSTGALLSRDVLPFENVRRWMPDENAEPYCHAIRCENHPDLILVAGPYGAIIWDINEHRPVMPLRFFNEWEVRSLEDIFDEL